MKKLSIFLLFLFFSVNIYAQFMISEKVDSNKYKYLNFDSLLTIKRLTLDSIILSQVSIPKRLTDKDINEIGIDGYTYYEYISKNKILLDSNLKRGINTLVDTFLIPIHQKMYEIANNFIKTDSNKTASPQ